MTLSDDIMILVMHWRRTAVQMRDRAELLWSTGQGDISTRLNSYADITEKYANDLEQLARKHLANTVSDSDVCQ